MKIVTTPKNKFYVKHTDRMEFIRFGRKLAFWQDDIRDATPFDTKAEAEIAIRQHRVPHAIVAEVELEA